MPAIPFILVGGFLGAGKTTLLGQAARRLMRRGMRVGIITNDQAAHLADTFNLRWQGFDVAEVAGGCFCCRFQDLLTSARQVIARHRPDVLLGEPVGSCTDLSATVLRPLQFYCRDELAVRPYGVLADLSRLRDLLRGTATELFPHSVLYIYSKQLEEADAVLLNKTDLSAPAEVAEVTAAFAAAYPQLELRPISAGTGEGVDAWLDWVLGANAIDAARRVAQINYDTYADGEAQLGWLNATVDLHTAGAADWQAACAQFMAALRDSLAARRAEVAHLKCFLATAAGALAASLTGRHGQPLLLRHGDPAAAASDAQMIVNARVAVGPAELRAEVEAALHAAFAGAAIAVRTLEAFRPSRPVPTHRFEDLPATDAR